MCKGAEGKKTVVQEKFREQKWILGSAVWFLWISTWMNCTEKQRAEKQKSARRMKRLTLSLLVCECVHEVGMEMKLLPGKIKQHCFFHEATKQGVRKQGRRRETRVTWAGPGCCGGSRTALLVTEWIGQQLVYSCHRKAGLRGHLRLWEALMSSQRRIPAFSSPSPHPRLHGRTANPLQETWLRSTRTKMLVAGKFVISDLEVH